MRLTVGAGPAPCLTAQVASAGHSGEAVYAENNGTGDGVFGLALGGGIGIRGARAASSSLGGVQGDDAGVGTGPGVIAQLFNTSNPSNALIARTAGSGAAVRAEGAHALDVHGSATFSRRGTATIACPTDSVTMAVPGAVLTATSMVFATLQTRLVGRYVESAVAFVGTKNATIYLNRAPGTAKRPESVTIAGLVLG